MLDLPKADWVVVDVEAGGLFPDDGARIGSIGIGWIDGDGEAQARAWPFDQGVRDKMPTSQMDMFEGDPNLPREAWDELMEWLGRQRLGAHNAKYDFNMVEAGTREWPGPRLLHRLRWDTLLGQRILDPVEPAGLDATAERLGIGRKADTSVFKAWLKRNGYASDRYDLVPWYMMEEYLLEDCRLGARLFQHQIQRMEPWSMDIMRRELDTLRTLYVIESRGIAYDHERSLAAADVLLERADRIEAGMPFKADINSAKRYFFTEQGLSADRYTDKGKPSLDEEQVRLWVNEGVEWAAEYDQVQKLRRAVSMWYRGYPEKAGPDGRLRTYYKQAHVKSGRMSVQRIQLQAIPKADKALEGVPMVRELLRAAPGKGLWNLDLAQAELRVAAKYAGCQTMLDMLLGGVDFHTETTKTVLEVPVDDPLFKEKRDIAKRLNFGAIFQIGGETFQATLSKLADIHLPVEECDRYVRQWRGTYPEFGRAYYKAMRLFERRGYVHLMPHTELEVRSYMGPRDYPNTAWNRVVQGSLAEFLKHWLVEVERQWPGFVVLTIHDSLVIEAPLDEGQQVSEEIAAWTAERATELFRIEMKCDIGMWTKSQEAIAV